MCSACGRISSRLHRDDAFQEAGVALNSCLCCLMGRAGFGAHANLPRWIKGEKTADCFLKVTVLSSPSRGEPRDELCQPQKPSRYLFLMRICSVLFWETWGDGGGFVASLQMLPIPLYFPQTQYSSVSDLAVIFPFISNVFRAVKAQRSVELCKLLSKLPRLELQTTVGSSRPVKQGDTVRVHVTSCFIVWVCVQPNRDWTWEPTANPGCCFPSQVSPPEISCTFQAKQPQTDDNSREQSAT